MTNRLQGFKENGAPRHVHLAGWRHAKTTVEKEILVLPVQPKKTPKRKRVLLETKATKPAEAAVAAVAPKAKVSKKVKSTTGQQVKVSKRAKNVASKTVSKRAKTVAITPASVRADPPGIVARD
ncbi:hypothetical protein PC114_g1766 [Phytophthora cactorum]|nr:hypothetical protein PC114_g1766 [Phytophthora cactorum]